MKKHETHARESREKRRAKYLITLFIDAHTHNRSHLPFTSFLLLLPLLVLWWKRKLNNDRTGTFQKNWPVSRFTANANNGEHDAIPLSAKQKNNKKIIKACSTSCHFLWWQCERVWLCDWRWWLSLCACLLLACFRFSLKFSAHYNATLLLCIFWISFRFIRFLRNRTQASDVKRAKTGQKNRQHDYYRM